MLNRVVPLTLLFLMLVLAGKSVENPQKIFQKANQVYQEKQFDQAVVLYDSLYQAGYRSPALFFNLGNAYYKANQIPESILFFEKAQKITGYREDIEHNLALAREQIPDRVEAETPSLLTKWWNTAIRYFSASTWGTLSIMLLWVITFAVAGFLFLSVPWLQRLSLFTGILGLVLCIGTVILTVERHQYKTETHQGVIFAPSVYVKSAPDKDSKDLFILHGGTKVALGDELDNWIKVKLADDKKGWIRTKSLKMI